MNGKPHTHPIQINRKFGHCGGGWVVTYGDTQVYVTWFGWAWGSHPERPKSERRIKRAIIKAIKMHDRGSIEASIKEAKRRQLEDHYQSLAGEIEDHYRSLAGELKPNTWASEQLDRANSNV